jgi:hypothetical protein
MAWNYRGGDWIDHIRPQGLCRELDGGENGLTRQTGMLLDDSIDRLAGGKAVGRDSRSDGRAEIQREWPGGCLPR